jgi:hypothetical protein
MLKHKCLLCGIEWGDPQATESDISHGYCPKCIRKKYADRIHRSQLQQGYSDCFDRGYNDCTEDRCWFRAACQDASVKRWKDDVIGAPKVLEIG